MCRLLAYIGPPTLIADVVLWPDRCSCTTPVRQSSGSCTASQHACAGSCHAVGRPALLVRAPGPPILTALLHALVEAGGCMRRSIIKQSYDARERKMDENLPSHLQLGNLNGDGCACSGPPAARIHLALMHASA